MTNAEVNQAVFDLKSWFTRTKCSKSMGEGASTADLQRLEKAIDARLPSSLKALLQEVNGGMYFMEKKQLSTMEIMDAVSDNEGKKSWKQGLIPFCGDEAGFLVIDTSRDDDVREFDADDGLGDSVADNFTRYLENYRNDLLGGHFEFLEDVGVVEKMGKGRK
jgi:hypothetical protein